MLAHNPMLCGDCEGRCMTAAGTQAELGNLTRLLTYHEHHGLRAEARRQFAALPAEAKRLVRTPTSTPPATPAPTASTSPGCCARSSVTWPDLPGISRLVPDRALR